MPCTASSLKTALTYLILNPSSSATATTTSPEFRFVAANYAKSNSGPVQPIFPHHSTLAYFSKNVHYLILLPLQTTTTTRFLFIIIIFITTTTTISITISTRYDDTDCITTWLWWHRLSSSITSKCKSMSMFDCDYDELSECGSRVVIALRWSATVLNFYRLVPCIRSHWLTDKNSHNLWKEKKLKTEDRRKNRTRKTEKHRAVKPAPVLPYSCCW